MMALLELGLFVIDVRLWNEDRARCCEPVEAMAIHTPWLDRHGIRLLWEEDFFAGFPWNQPKCPPELRDACTVIQSMYERARSNKRVISLEQIGDPPEGVRIEPDLLAGNYHDDARLAWQWLLSWAVAAERAAEGISVPTWARALVENAHEVLVLRKDAPSKPLGSAMLLRNDTEWKLFVKRYQRPDLRGRRVVVLGGNRDKFERARIRLVEYGLAEKDFRRLPPAYEETRTKQETRTRLQNADVLLVCTNRCKHTDTDHISGELSCARIDLENDTETTLVEAVLNHFRAQDGD